MIQEAASKNPAPRGMDTLECQPDPNDPQLIQVKYENFKQGEEEKIARIVAAFTICRYAA